MDGTTVLPAVEDTTRSDNAIRARVLAELRRQPWWQPAWSTVWVTDGVVYLLGVARDEAGRMAARRVAERVPGVRDVVDRRARSADWRPMF